MIRWSIALDCDGVILDSNEMKCDAFRETLSGYSDEAAEPFLAFQRGAFGTSRYRLFDIFFADYLRRAPAPGEREARIAEFATICTRLYPRQAFTPGAAETLAALARDGAELWVVSGSDQSELRGALGELGVDRHFKSIYGSPTTKADNLARVKREAAHQLVFVGDADADFRASAACDVPFIGMPTYSAAPEALLALRESHGFPVISTLAEISGLLQAPPAGA